MLGCLYALSVTFFLFLPFVGDVDLGLCGELPLLPLPSKSVGRLWLDGGLADGGVEPVEAIQG